MWRIQSTCLRLALAFLFFSSALGATKAPSEYRFETLAGGACARTGEPARVEVSLAELERLARDRHENGRSTSDLTLGGMTTLEAVRWDRVRREIMLEGLAGECEVEPIPLDAFVEALRIAEASSMWMSLEPERQGREVRHRVEFFPPGLANTHLLASMTKADYFL
ncbi:MAG TPA: hypothetical protein VF173_20410, partial [Thermoanaerobaculia bacterium]|nr:hypothetical protein [Thermoanaerobaculia bacterium]